MNTIISQIEKFEKNINLEKLTDKSIENLKDLIHEQYLEIGKLIRYIDSLTASSDQELINDKLRELKKRISLFGEIVKGLHQWFQPLKTEKSIVDEIFG